MTKTDWTIWLLGALVLFSTVAFGAYYYYDRYNHPSQGVVDHQIQSIEALVRDNPTNPDLRVAAASAYLEGGLADQAIQQSQQALTINPNNQDALTVLSQAYRKAGDLQGAINALTQVVGLNKDNPLAKIDPHLERVYYDLGTLYTEQGKYAEAISSLKLALGIDKTDADAHFALGMAYQDQNDHSNAAQEFQEAIRYIPDFVEAFQGLEKSETALGKAVEAKYAHAMVMLFKGQPADAAAQLEQLIAQSPGSKYAYFGLGLAYEKLGKRDQAAQALREFLKMYPNDIASQQALGRLNRSN
jgi:protein O-GlcNAc transferase